MNDKPILDVTDTGMGEPSFDASECKVAVNNLLWMRCGPSMTLGDAEKLACAIVD